MLNSIKALQQPIPALSSRNILDHNQQQPMYPTLFSMLLSFVEFACCPPKVESFDQDNYTHIRGRAVEWVVMNYVPLAENSMKMVQELYKIGHAKESVVEEHVLESIVKVLFMSIIFMWAVLLKILPFSRF